MKANELSIGWAMKQSDPVAALQRVINNVKAWGRKHQEQLECYVGGPLIMAFCFALYYLASVLEGGAA
ncbi:MAG: hypothetical protein IJ253_12705 [Bacteroidaceae bacterium]|nr:hypothetical protein [Bacteroidaceae bacterium]